MTCYGKASLLRIMEKSCLSVRLYVLFTEILKGLPLNLVSSNLRHVWQTVLIRLRTDKSDALVHYSMAHQIPKGVVSDFGEWLYTVLTTQLGSKWVVL